MTFEVGGSPVGSEFVVSLGTTTSTTTTPSTPPSTGSSGGSVTVISTNYARYLASLGLTYEQIQYLVSVQRAGPLSQEALNVIIDQDLSSLTSVTIESTPLTQEDFFASSQFVSGAANDVATFVRQRLVTNGVMDAGAASNLDSYDITSSMYNSGFRWGSLSVRGSIARAEAEEDGNIGVGLLGAVSITNEFKFLSTVGMGDVTGVTLSSDSVIAWDSTTNAIRGLPDLFLRRSGAGILSQDNGTNAQEFRVAKTLGTGAAVYASLGHSALSDVFGLSLDGFGSVENMSIENNLGGSVDVYTGPAGAALKRWSFAANGSLLPSANNAFDIGTALLRVQDGYFGNVDTTTLASTLATLASLVMTGLQTWSTTNGLTASTTQTQAGGLALTGMFNRLTTVAHSGDAVTLPALTPGQFSCVFNDGANPAKVFPFGASDTIDGGSAGASVTLTNALRAIFFCVAANTIISAQFGAKSA